MEFLDLLTWLLLAGTGLILLAAAITVPGSGLVGLAALGGLTAWILFMALGTPDWASWAQVGMAIVGILGGTLATNMALRRRTHVGHRRRGPPGRDAGPRTPVLRRGPLPLTAAGRARRRAGALTGVSTAVSRDARR